MFTIVYLSLYEAEEKNMRLNTRLEALYSYFNKFTNISFPIAYSIAFYADYHEMPVIYVITPTDSRRATQLADLTRMRNTLWLVPKVFWILVEDAVRPSPRLTRFLAYSKLPHVHLSEATPEELLVKRTEKSWSKPRGVPQRNKALAWLRAHPEELHHAGVVYFADDDNTYDIRLFEEVSRSD